MPFRTLYAKLVLVLVVLLLSVGLLYALLSTSATRHYLQRVSQQFNRDLARNLVMDQNLVAEGRLDQAALMETFHQYMLINPSIEIYLLDREGLILAYSADPGKVKRKRVSLGPIQAFLSGRSDYPLLGDDPRSHDRRKAFSVTPVPSAEEPEGYLYVVLRGEEFDSVEGMIRESHFLRLSGWAVMGSLGVALVVGLVLFFILTRRLRRLTAAMEGFEEGDFGAYLPYEGKGAAGDEIDRLGETFDRMAARIAAQLEALKRQDALRRELVAQVSHDLRTPLAVLRGYLESLKLKEGELSAEERADYLATALSQSERLTRRVGELFELARLDARETKVERELFAPAELVQDVVQKLQLRARQKRIRLELEPVEELSFVHADIALTERVLENLIENAFAHTLPGGSVTLAVVQRDERVEVSVADTGSGILQSDLPHIFETFYRADDRNGEEVHAGLGLAIAKRIVELQRGEIGVTSRKGEGSLFKFSLPRKAVNG